MILGQLILEIFESPADFVTDERKTSVDGGHNIRQNAMLLPIKVVDPERDKVVFTTTSWQVFFQPATFQ